MRAVLVLMMTVAAATTVADPLPPDPFEMATTDAAVRQTRSYRELRNADDLRDLNPKGALISKCLHDREHRPDKLSKICRWHLSQLEKKR
jgi:hypothetical protein